MKIEFIEYGEDYDESVAIIINGREFCFVGNLAECPEDANLVRDLSFVRDIPSALRAAYEAGKNGEDFSVEIKQGDWGTR